MYKMYSISINCLFKLKSQNILSGTNISSPLPAGCAPSLT